MTARAVRRWDGAVVLTFPYDAWLIEALKSEIPAHARSYDADRKAWTVTRPYAGRALAILRVVFPDAETGDDATGRASQATPTAPTDAALAVLHLRSSASPPLIEAAYRVLARMHHPDAGGDAEQMRSINAAVETLRKRAG